MTISTTDTYIEFSSDGLTKDFYYTFRVDKDEDMLAYVDGEVDVSTYLVHRNEDDLGGYVEFLSPPPVSSKIVLSRRLEITQETNYDPYGPFQAESHEKALDVLTMICQQLNDSVVWIQTRDRDGNVVEGRTPPYASGQIWHWDLDTKTLVTSPAADFFEGELAGFLPLTGGVLTGNLEVQSEVWAKGNGPFDDLIGFGLMTSDDIKKGGMSYNHSLDVVNLFQGPLAGAADTIVTLKDGKIEVTTNTGKSLVPTDPHHLVNKVYVDGLIGGEGFLPLTGGVLTGNLEVQSEVWCKGNGPTDPLIGLGLMTSDGIVHGGIGYIFNTDEVHLFQGPSVGVSDTILILKDGKISVSTNNAADLTPVDDHDLATKVYVDAQVGGVGFLPLTGGALSGNLEVTSEVWCKGDSPTDPLIGLGMMNSIGEAKGGISYEYANEDVAIFQGPSAGLADTEVILKGGNILMKTNTGQDLTPTDPDHLCIKSYVDSQVGGVGFLPLTGGVLTGNLEVQSEIWCKGNGPTDPLIGVGLMSSDGVVHGGMGYIYTTDDVHIFQGPHAGASDTILILKDGKISTDSNTGASLVPTQPSHMVNKAYVDSFIGKSKFAYRTVADMIADDGELTIGFLVSTLGYLEEGDGGGNYYEIVVPGAGVDDGGSYINIGSKMAKALFRDEINIRQFGAAGDDVADDYPAIQNALTFVGDKSKVDWNATVLCFPAGTYRMSQVAVCTVSVVFDQDNGLSGVSLIGESTHSTYLVATPTNTTGLIKLTSNGNSEIWTVENMSFLSDLDEAAVVDNGVALWVDSTVDPGDGGFGTQQRRTVKLSDLAFFGYGGDGVERHNRGHFTKAVYMENKWWPWAHNLFIRGFDTHGIHCVDCYSPEFVGVMADWEGSYGVVISGGTYEDFRLQDSFLVGQTNAFVLQHDPGHINNALYEPGGAISNCHLNSVESTVIIQYHRQVVISGCYFYMPKGGTGLIASILLDGAEDITVSNCQFLEPGHYTSDADSSVAIRGKHRVMAMLTGCLFNHGGIGVVTDVGTAGHVMVVGASITGVQSGGLWAPFKLMADNAGIASFNYNRIDAGDPHVENVTVSDKAGSGASSRTTQKIRRPDFASNTSNVQLFSQRVEGYNSVGDTELAATQRVDWIDNTDGSEDSQIVTYLRSAGATSAVMTVNGSTQKVNALGGFSVNGQDVTEKGSANGGFYTKHYDGTLVQYGHSSANAGYTVITLPMAFSNTGYAVTCQVTDEIKIVTLQNTRTVTTFSAKGYNIQGSSASTVSFDYVAVGRWK